MEMHIVDIIRFAIYIIVLVIAIAVMIKADDNNALRRLTAILAAILIYFNEQLGRITYLLIGSTLEVILAVMGVGFVIILAGVIMIFPLIAVIRWLIR